MEYSNTLMLSAVVVCVVILQETSAVSTSNDWLTKSLTAISQEPETQNVKTRHTNSKVNNEFSSDQTTDTCCYNGGICIMNTFCHCKKNYYGRFCEHRVRHRSCGTIKHGTWMAAGCHLCHCFDSKLTCKTTTIRGCDKLSYVEGHEDDPDYMVGMDTKVEDYEAFYEDEYSSVLENSSSSMCSVAVTTLLFGVAMVTYATWNFVS
ncbi:hypothetical protein ACF0H5_004135 [Mactra antiquata]